MANEQNLKHFPKGVSGNPHGRPKGATEIALKYQKALKEISKGRGKPIDWTNQDAILEAIMKRAKRGNLACVQYIEARAYGKLPEHIEITPKPEYDLSKLTDDELDAFESLMRKLNAGNDDTDEADDTTPADA